MAQPSAVLDERARPTTDSRLRVVLLLDVQDGAQQRFLDAYEQMRYQVSAVPGHLMDQLCQSTEDPLRWLITSEWEAAEPFLTWLDSPEHREVVRPLSSCVRDTRSLRFTVFRETFGTRSVDSALPPRERNGSAHPVALGPGPDGITRHALTFFVKPGSEQTVAGILAGYTSPAAKVDDTTRLVRTSLFMRGNQVVRSVEVVGDLVAALRHVAAQPEVRAVEEAINPYLEQARDLSDPLSARDFFMRAALPAVHHHARAKQPPSAQEPSRYAFSYPARPGCGAAVAEYLSRQDKAAVNDSASPLVRSTVFQREDCVVRLVDLTVPPQTDPAAALGLTGPRAGAVLARLLRSAPELRDDDGRRAALAGWELTPITDRRSPQA
ncbi:SchA/CurD-like domain-containing protein [Catenulispora rubra]|uniref:SchA/CurD-like domain-containing protein n=1 Tax=Catenulispora rubra TaxID=280293 RepID=UPI00189237BF|nr:SchA/CurD-like domain-containing protein [Catenulispora rubra]